MATIFKLIIEDDEGKTTVYPLADGDVSIGRKEGNTIRLMERNVSRRHARLLRNNGAVFIEDLDSYNGIRINGERISGRYEVKEGDLVEIGDYHLALQRQEMEVPVEPAPAERSDGWPAAGTVPDFRLPDEILEDGPPPEPQVSTRDTIVDQPAPPEIPAAMAHTVEGNGEIEPQVKPPSRGSDGGGTSLPPFPTPGGSPGPKAPFAAAAPVTSPGEDEATKALNVGPARVSAVPRLVCVSTSYAGREFALTRPELIIGRVEDNDIVIEHRSVSRNHAKILYDGRTHKIIDLQSANGILVNGEEYAMTDLRKGDLIELGHVRFRFVPAGEDFAATDEEAREMREAGVEPPAPEKPQKESMKAVEVPQEVSYDPSTAATVTDTPLSALNMNEVLAPKVEAPQPQTQPQPRQPSHPKNGATRRAAEDGRPTEINHMAAKRPPAPAAPTTPLGTSPVPEPSREEFTKPQAVSADADLPRAGGAKPIVPLLAVVLLLGVGAAVIVTWMSGPDGSADRQLEQLFNAGKYQEASSFCAANAGNFKNTVESLKLCGKAEERAKQPSSSAMPEKAPEPTPVAEVEPPPPEEPEETEEEVVEPPPSEPQPVAAVKRPVKRPRRRTVRRSEAQAQKLFNKGRKALLAGRLSAAKESLLECVQKSPSFADCHRLLGVLFAQLDDTRNSVKHYRRYVQLKPNAPDAPRVRRMIRDVEAQAGP